MSEGNNSVGQVKGHQRPLPKPQADKKPKKTAGSEAGPGDRVIIADKLGRDLPEDFSVPGEKRNWRLGTWRFRERAPEFPERTRRGQETVTVECTCPDPCQESTPPTNQRPRRSEFDPGWRGEK